MSKTDEQLMKNHTPHGMPCMRLQSCRFGQHDPANIGAHHTSRTGHKRTLTVYGACHLNSRIWYTKWPQNVGGLIRKEMTAARCAPCCPCHVLPSQQRRPVLATVRQVKLCGTIKPLQSTWEQSCFLSLRTASGTLTLASSVLPVLWQPDHCQPFLATISDLVQSNFGNKTSSRSK